MLVSKTKDESSILSRSAFNIDTKGGSHISINKKAEQLGMNPSTASHRLVKDILYKLIQEKGELCYRCNNPMTRDTFSIEHKIAWLDSEDALNLFFDLDNIAFSHLSCNIKSSRNGGLKKHTTDEDLRQARNKQDKVWRDKLHPESGLTNRQIRYRDKGV